MWLQSVVVANPLALNARQYLHAFGVVSNRSATAAMLQDHSVVNVPFISMANVELPALLIED